MSEQELTDLPEALRTRYLVRGEVGRGASGVVWRAFDGFADREVAIKMAYPHIFKSGDDGQQAARKAWLNEVRLAGSLKHPCIVEVYDAAVSEDGAWLVMEYLENGTLDPFTEPSRLLPIPEVFEIAYQCASGLEHACQAGIVHRDIKPANLQYLGKGEVKVADFGAAWWSSSEDATQVMDIGSLAYMAPELFRHHVTPQADIYALGVVLYRLLTGHYPFEAQHQAGLMYAILNEEAAPVSSLRTDLTPAVDEFIGRMLARDLEIRFNDWGGVLRALATLTPGLAGRSAEASQPAQAELHGQLRQLPLLADLNDAQLWELLRMSKWRRQPAGTVLVREGGEAVSCYLLLSGEARVSHQGRLIALLTEGALFGELAFAEAKPSARSATVTADSEVVFGKWPYHRLRNASPELQSRMLQVFFRLAAERLKKSDERYLSLYKDFIELRDQSR